MKPLLIAGIVALVTTGQALAADLPQPPPPPPRAPAAYIPAPPPEYSWAGIYVGVNGGYGFGNSKWTVGSVSTGDFNVNGGVAGGTLGGNFQVNQFVFGLEGDIDWSGVHGSVSCGTPAILACETKGNWLGTVRGRLGFAIDRVLLYGTGGAAFGDIDAGFNGGSFDNVTKVGWAAGAGIEFGIFQNFTARVEYLFVDLGKASCAAASCGAVTDVSLDENLVRAGLDYKFGF
jgi:outer membrane immunogenic protein